MIFRSAIAGDHKMFDKLCYCSIQGLVIYQTDKFNFVFAITTSELHDYTNRSTDNRPVST